MSKSEGKLDTVIGPDTSVKGDLHVGGSLRLDGQVEGRIDVAETFQTGPRSLLKGEVHTRDAVVAGRVEGDVYASDTVELQAGAQVIGNVSCKGLVIQRDCLFQGNCAMVRQVGESGRPDAD
jgi:cytoskeletal protein CcmA (bactofilin family)